MSLIRGARLGPYEIDGPIGAGGMGEVYRARDTRLGRDVAIKVLPESVAADAAARARFEREARAVAALSHPNIVAIHDIGTQPADRGSVDTLFVVMELLDGESLRARLSKAPLAPARAVQVAREIALGLAAAHAKAVVHRDIKPENVFVTSAGHVKILDFGLARQTQAAVASGQTDTTVATSPGLILGTVGYMSPEQVRGDTVDARSDLFSLGCVLFETVTGKRAFERGTAAETMTAILRDDPPDLTRADVAVPPAVDQIVRRCLEKHPDARFQSASDLAFALQTSSSSHEAVRGAAPARSPSPPSRWPAAAVVALALGAIAGHYLWLGPALTRAAQPFAFDQISDGRGVQTEPTIAPDGKSVVYAQQTDGTSRLFLLRVGSRAPIALSRSNEDDSQPAFSPDGDRLAFRSERNGGGLFVMDALGESVRRLTTTGFNPTWSPDGKQIAYSLSRFASPSDIGAHERGLAIVIVATGVSRVLVKDFYALQPAWSPHGDRIAFWSLNGQGGQRDIVTVAADGSDAAQGGVRTTDDPALDWSPTWSPDGASIYFSSSRGGTLNIWRVAVDEQTGRSAGEPEPVTSPTNWTGYLSFSRDGSRLAFASLNWQSTLERVAFDPVKGEMIGAPSIVLRTARVIRDHGLSPDGQWVAFMEIGTQESIVLARLDGSEYRRLTDDAFRNRSPVWSPDGQRIAFYSDRSGSYDVWTIKPDGSGLTKVTEFGHINFPVWSPDGKRMALSTSVSPQPWWQIVDVGESAVKPPAESLPQTDAGTYFRPLSWSSDGKRLVGAVVASDGSNRGVAIYDLAATTFASLQARSIQHASTIWLPDNRRFIMRDDGGIWMMDAATGTRKLLVHVGGYVIGRSIAVARDGRSITYTETGTQGEVWLATLKK
jgi:Tol biopolymer transport system component